ncbi:MAG: UBP-type zinc finger domain-containing protein [Thermoanaerobaculia bacterium]
MSACGHLAEVTKEQFSRPPNTPDRCDECLLGGDSWVQLRECLACGHVGCCDSSKNKHATKHFASSRHAVMHSLHPGDRWMWCYVDSASATME